MAEIDTETVPGVKRVVFSFACSPPKLCGRVRLSGCGRFGWVDTGEYPDYPGDEDNPLGEYDPYSDIRTNA